MFDNTVVSINTRTRRVHIHAHMTPVHSVTDITAEMHETHDETDHGDQYTLLQC